MQKLFSEIENHAHGIDVGIIYCWTWFGEQETVKIGKSTVKSFSTSVWNFLSRYNHRRPILLGFEVVGTEELAFQREKELLKKFRVKRGEWVVFDEKVFQWLSQSCYPYQELKRLSETLKPIEKSEKRSVDDILLSALERIIEKSGECSRRKLRQSINAKTVSTDEFNLSLESLVERGEIEIIDFPHRKKFLVLN